MKPILIIYPFYNQRNLMETFALKLKDKGLMIDILCLSNGELLCQSNIKWNVKSISILKNSSLIQNKFILRCQTLLKKWYFSSCHFPKMVKEYGLVDFHSFTSLEYIWLMKQCKKAHVQYDVTLWGSDVLRVHDKIFKKRRDSYYYSRYIKGINPLITVLKTHYGKLLDSKYRENYFGNSEIDVIESLDDSTFKVIKERIIPRAEGKLIVTCGYNSQPAQQHMLILDAIAKLNNEIKKQIHIVLPLTYPVKGAYVDKVCKMANELGVSYTALVNYLTNEEVAVLRKSTDITINIQKTDAFAASIQSHLYCQNVVILGEWLYYPKYEKEDVFYIKSSINNLPLFLDDIIQKYNQYKNKCISNSQKIRRISSWDNCIDGWTDLYKELS